MTLSKPVKFVTEIVNKSLITKRTRKSSFSLCDTNGEREKDTTRN